MKEHGTNRVIINYWSIISNHGDIGLNLLFVIIILVVGILLALLLFYNKMPSLGESIYLRGLSNLFSGRNSIGTGIPELSKKNFIVVPIEPITGYNKTNNRINQTGNKQNCSLEKQILAYSLACWKLGEFGKEKQDFPCYQLVISKDCNNETISILSISELLLQEELCDILQTNESGCGAKNQLLIKTQGVIEPPTNILIEYKNSRIVIS